MEVKDIIKERRTDLGLTMKELADKVGVSEGTVSRWESGNISNMKRDKIAALAKILEIPYEILMGWETDADRFSRTVEAFNADHPYLTSPNEYMRLTSNEKVLINKYRTLNDDGKSKLMERVDELIGLGYNNSDSERKNA